MRLALLGFVLQQVFLIIVQGGGGGGHTGMCRVTPQPLSRAQGCGRTLLLVQSGLFPG